LKKWRAEIMSKGKYFLYIHYMDPHAPYHRREPWYVPKTDRREDLISAYDSEINFVDRHFQEVFDLFKWQENTLLIITADHGEGLWDHGKMGHGNTLYREEIQVPLLFYLPGGATAKRVTALASTIDILPSVRAIIGLPADENDEGMSLTPLIEGRENDFEDRFLFPYLWKMVKKEIEFRAVLHKKWHFIVQMPKKKEIFNLIGDKLETHNHYFDAYKLAEMMEKKFSLFMKESKKYKQETSNFKLDREKLKKLKSLGYVQD
ncbi:MAG: sulfatase-like hydrolase/transferase, partial [Candidatus Aminicenantes bacterium]|nr:sulfatase-like hydrolase/transferase [Candidatus Aminicenantes bacterium]